MGGLVEDVAEETVVDEVVFGVFILRELTDILIEEAQGAAQESGEG